MRGLWTNANSSWYSHGPTAQARGESCGHFDFLVQQGAGEPSRWYHQKKKFFFWKIFLLAFRFFTGLHGMWESYRDEGSKETGSSLAWIYPSPPALITASTFFHLPRCHAVLALPLARCPPAGRAWESLGFVFLRILS